MGERLRGWRGGQGQWLTEFSTGIQPQAEQGSVLATCCLECTHQHVGSIGRATGGRVLPASGFPCSAEDLHIFSSHCGHCFSCFSVEGGHIWFAQRYLRRLQPLERTEVIPTGRRNQSLRKSVDVDWNQCNRAAVQFFKSAGRNLFSVLLTVNIYPPKHHLTSSSQGSSERVHSFNH